MIARRLKCEIRCAPAHEVVEHHARAFEVGDDAVDERRDHRDVARFASLHLVRFVADGDHFAVTLLTATTDGSSTTTPRPRTAMSVLADPIRWPLSLRRAFRRAVRLMSLPVLPIKDMPELA
jgi:hypothetical protein